MSLEYLIGGFDGLTLEFFLAVTETGSLTRAAEKVGRTQSAVSQQMTKLETQLGKSLFCEGQEFYINIRWRSFFKLCAPDYKAPAEAIDRFREPELQGEVRFGLPEDFASVLLSDVLSEYSHLHPRILLNVECDLTLTLFDRFKRKEFDMVLVKMSRPEDFPNGIDVWSEPLEWVGNPLFFTQSQQEAVPLVLSPQPCVYRSRAIKSLEKSKRKWRIVFSSHSYAGTIAAVKAGMGVTVLPRNMVPADLPIVKHRKGIPGLDNTHISLLKHTNKNIAVNSFEKFVIERIC